MPEVQERKGVKRDAATHADEFISSGRGSWELWISRCHRLGSTQHL